MSKESRRVTEGTTTRENRRAMEAPENSANGWEANENGRERLTWQRDGD